jgi:hypothetical protein
MCQMCTGSAARAPKDGVPPLFDIPDVLEPGLEFGSNDLEIAAQNIARWRAVGSSTNGDTRPDTQERSKGSQAQKP